MKDFFYLLRSVYEDQPVFTSPSSKEVDDRAARLAEALKIQTVSTNTSHVESEVNAISIFQQPWW